ncbi:cytochrome c oxidase accessory protein CcoG [Consotaella salsifontis]|uniref:cytochrome c oxidase accessory protein CcoG n=1 Tax=Consotaella salsifontis TaxID=1365950 RepID=UPI00099930D2
MQNEVENFNVEAVNSGLKKKRPSLYAARKKIFPKRAYGSFRRLKWIIMAVTLSIYYLTPWLRWDRGSFAPDQAVLVDLANRRFYFFFIEIWPQEFYYVAGLLIMAGLGLFLITSVAGRVWCGYTCPQTVWVDLFLVVERFFEGDRNQRMALDKAPWTLSKIWKRVAKHSTWLVIAILTGGAWIFYFADAPTLLGQLVHFDAPSVAYSTIGILTATTYIFGGLMREQVCTYMCPWPRIQAAMLDENSLVVTYNDWRGEPRSRHQKKAIAQGLPVGDCVDCKACVAVCPMGIDIRQGQQLECITCALCIDACNGVMERVGRDRGLISYATLSDYNANMARAKDAEGHIVPSKVRDATGKLRDGFVHFRWREMVRLRTLIYLGIWLLIGLLMVASLATRDRLGAAVAHDRNPLYVRLSDGSIRNGYTLKISNMVTVPRDFSVSISGLTGATLELPGVVMRDDRSVVLRAEPDRVLTQRVLVIAPTEALAEPRHEFTFVISDVNGGERTTIDAVFEAPEDVAR